MLSLLYLSGGSLVREIIGSVRAGRSMDGSRPCFLPSLLNRMCRAVALCAVAAACPHFDASRVTTHEVNGRTFLAYDGAPLSPWHDIPFVAPGGFVHFVCEIAVGSKDKFEIHKARSTISLTARTR